MKYLILPAGIAAASLFPLKNANAHGSPVLFTPHVHEGEAAVEAKGAYDFDAEDDADEWGGELTAGYGITSFWHSEAGFEFEGVEHDDTDINAFVFENKFQISQPGAWPVDVGMKVDYARSLTGGPDEIGGLLLLQKDIGRYTNLSNIGIAREFGEDAEDDNEYSFAYGLSYNLSDTLAIGGEWYSEFGSLKDDSDDFDEQSHRIGPVVYGSLMDRVAYDAGVLVGVSDAAPDATLKLNLEYEF